MNQLNVEVRYSKRTRRGTIRIMPDQVVRVTVPYGIDKSDIQKMLQSKTKWILEKLRILENAKASENRIEFTNGSLLPFLGESLKISVISGRTAVSEAGGVLTVSLPLSKTTDTQKVEGYVKKLIIEWYKDQAARKIKERVFYYAQLSGLTPRSIALKNYRARWGACSSKGDLIFNWQIITFDTRLFDYVIAHEICHLKEMNHSVRFYQLLSGLGFEKREIHQRFKSLKNIF